MSVSQPLPHDSALLHVTGAARYVDDIPTPAGCLHLAFGLSPVVRGRVTRLDLAAVRAAPGVVAVLAAGDLRREADCGPVDHDEPLLAKGEVHYHGQPVFLVIAQSHLAARKAACMGVIEVDARPPILTIEDALAAESWYEDGPVRWSEGDADAAIDAAAHVVEGRIEMGGQEHFYLEGQAALAWPQENGDMLVQSSTQHPSEVQHKVAEAIGRPMHAVRVETRRMGGGFGGKESQGNALAIACAVASELTGQPCKMRYDRDDDMAITGKRHAFRVEYRAGFDGRGKLAGVTFRQYTPAGWSRDLTSAVADRAMLTADNAYHLPAVKIESYRLRTNTCSATAYRGFGGPQGMLGIERVMDHIAHELKLDPLKVRRRNYYISKNATAPQRHSTHYGQRVEDFELHEMTAALTRQANYEHRLKAVEAWNASHEVVKKGIALTPVKFGISFTLTHLNQAGALVHIYQDGSVHLNHGGTEMGQGLNQKVAQVAAQALGLPMSAIRITATDTQKVPNTSATAASSGTDLNGMAVAHACQQLKMRLKRYLSHKWKVKPGQIRFEGGQVKAGRKHAIRFADLAAEAHGARISLSSTGFYRTPKLRWDRIAGRGRPFYYFAYGAAISEVALDTLTGENRILRTDIVHDAGASLNPALDVGQIEGGYVQGAGWLTMEELIWDQDGRLMTHAPSTYKIPACSDRPDVFNVALWNGENREETIHRSKAVGEPPFLLGVSAFMALSHAVAACGPGYPALDAPATPERLLAAIRQVRA